MIVGVVGLGYWGSKVVEEYVELREDGRIDGVAACDIDTDRLQECDADEKYQNFGEMVSKVDAVHLCTGNDSHYNLAKTALNAGRDILVEKPLTVDPNKAYDLVQIASESGRILQTGHIFRFANVVRKIQELYSESYFGDVYHVNLRWTHYIEPIQGTNVLWDLLPHPVDILNYVTGEWPTEGTVTGIRGEYRGDTLEHAKFNFNIDNITASIEVSWADKVKRRTFEITGEKRCLRADCVNQEIEVYDGESWEQIECDKNNTIRAEANNFVNAIETGENMFNSAIVGARAVDSIQMMEESL